MRSITKNGSRLYAALALAAALVGAAVSAPAPAAAGTRNAEFTCDPSYELCDIQYLYYSNANKTTQVGYAEDPCDSGYTLIWGYATAYVTKRVFYCPI
jgi:hypothetical protein